MTLDKNSDFTRIRAVQDPAVMELLKTPLDLSCLQNKNILYEFLDYYDYWIKSSTLNTFKGLDQFAYKTYSHATTEVFDKFYINNSTRRIRFIKGEYVYHQISSRTSFDWEWINNDTLNKGDAVLISLPFCDTGNKHHEYDDIMQTCTLLKIPVLVDCAYFGICSDIEFDLSHPCITDVAFSLSKNFPVAHARIGICYTRENVQDGLTACTKENYTNRLGAELGNRFIKEFSPDYIPKKYKPLQLEICNILNVEASNTVLFGIGNSDWDQYNRGCETNRLSFHRQFVDMIG